MPFKQSVKKRAQGRARIRRYRQTTKGRAYNRKYLYGITEQEVNLLRRLQKDRCKICRKKFTRASMHVDHNHKTGKVRGLLCPFCNWAVGFLNDSSERCLEAAKYLKTNEDILAVIANKNNVMGRVKEV